MGNTYKKRGQIRCSASFADADGDALDPDTVVFVYRPPGETRTELSYGADGEVVRESVGIYHVDLDVDVNGDWVYGFYATGTGRSGNETSFHVEIARVL